MMTDDRDSIPEQTADSHLPAPTPLTGSGVLCDPHHVRGDLDLVLQAIRRGWPISPELRRAIVDALGSLALDDDLRAAERVKAAGILVQADRVSIEAAKLATDA